MNRTVPHRNPIALRSNWAAVICATLLLVWAPVAIRADVPPARAPLLPADLPIGQTFPLRIETANRAVRLTLENAARVAEYGTLRPAPGHSFILLNAEWENIIPLTDAGNAKLATTYKIPNLADHLYLVANGCRLLRLRPDAGSLPGHVPTRDFTLEKLGDRIRGNLLFEVADGPIDSLELRFYDFAHGHMAVPLGGAAAPIAKPVFAPIKNEVLEVGVFGIRPATDLAGQAPPAGMAFFVLDLRARSLITLDGDASAFDPKAAPGAKMKVGTVADWKDAHKYAQLVADGEYAYAPLAPQTTPAAEPRFLPDLMTGDELAFLVPAQRQSLELRCDFPNAKMPDGRVFRPRGITLPIEGARPPLPARPAIATVRDGAIFDVAIVAQQVSDELGDARAVAGQRFLALDVTVRNMGSQQEFFQPKAQLKYVTEKGAQSEADGASFTGPHAPIDPIYIPNGERRTFTLAYRIGAGETRPRLAYAAVTQGASKVLALKPIEPVVAAAVQQQQQQQQQQHQQQQQPAAPAASPSQLAQPVAQRPTEPPAGAPPAATPTVAAADVPAIKPVEAEGLGPRPHGPAQGIAGVGLTAEQVNAAIDKGAAGLWAWIKQEDLKSPQNHFGEKRPHVLAALALVHVDAHKKIPEFNAALKGYLAGVEPHQLPTYENGLLCMLIEAYGDPSFEPKLREAARWLIEAQGPEGTWTYQVNVPADIFKAPKPQGVLQVSGGTPPGQRGQEWTRLTDWKVGVDGDNSNTQYAILGLQAASRAGVPVPAEVWKRALATARKGQADDGGWDYHGHSRTGYGSMTSAGICALAICRDQLGEQRATQDPAIDRGVAWLDKNFKVEGHAGYQDGKDWAFYYLYSLERVGRILDTEFMGPHEWYPLGAKYLVGAQKPDGLWAGLAGQEKVDAELPSSFALLFLTRATPSLKPIERHGPGMLKTAAVAPNNRFYIILDCSGSMLDNMDGRMKFDIARGSVQAMIDSLPPNSQVALRVYGHRKSALDPDCDLDTELKIPMGPLNKAKFIATLNSLRSRGKTPLALSIEDAIRDLGAIDEHNPVTLLLLTDGGEDTIRPRGNPVKACQDLAKVKNLRFQIVGFDINQPDWSAQLQAMAQASGGQYWPAARGAELEQSVRNAVLGIPEAFTVVDADGHEVAHGAFGDAPRLASGKYHFKTVFAGRTFDQEFYVSPDEVTSVTFDASQVKPGDIAAGDTAGAPATAPQAAATDGAKPINWPKFCSKCGAPLTPGQKFCSKCGAKVEAK